MAPAWHSEVLNWPYVNLPINAEQSRITSALIDLRKRREVGRRVGARNEMEGGGGGTFSGRGRWTPHDATDSQTQVGFQLKMAATEAHSEMSHFEIYVTPEC